MLKAIAPLTGGSSGTVITTGSFVTGETPTGTVNGTTGSNGNADFVTAYEAAMSADGTTPIMWFEVDVFGLGADATTPSATLGYIYGTHYTYVAATKTITTISPMRLTGGASGSNVMIPKVSYVRVP